MRRLSCLVVLLSVLILPVVGQNVSGTLTGTVLDPAKAVIPGADVKLTNQATGVAFQSASNEVGIFIFSGLQAGTYTLEVVLPGFKTLTVKGIVVTAA